MIETSKAIRQAMRLAAELEDILMNQRVALGENGGTDTVIIRLDSDTLTSVTQQLALLARTVDLIEGRAKDRAQRNG